MKKLFSILSIAAISFAAITSCAKEEQASVAEEGINITVIASDKDVDNDPSKTKTYVSEDGNTVHVYWRDVETEKLMVYELIDEGETDIRYNVSSKAEIIDEGVTAAFATTLYGGTPEGSHTYKYTAIYPSSCASKSSDGKYRVEIPQIQNLNGTNFAPNADVLVGIPYDNGNTRITDGAKIDYQFNRFGTTVKMTLKGINEGETVSKVEITAPKGISGFGVVDLTTGGINDITGYKTTMTLNLNQVVDETTNISVWFRVLSGTWTVSNDKPLKVVVTTDKATYTKEITAIASLQNKLEFAEGGLTAFGISGMTRDENSVIEDGDYVITAVNESTKYIMLSYESGNNNIKSETYTLNDEGNFVFNSSSTHDPEECVYTFTRVTEEGDFKGCYTIRDWNGNYIYAAGKNTENHLKADNPDNKDASFYWTITCVEGVYSIVAKSTNRNNLKFNSSNNPPIFSCYASGQKAVTLYPASKLVIDRTPRIEVSANELNYAADGTTKDSPITVNAKYCDATAEATTGSDWISGVSISEGVLVLTVSANTDAEERQGIVTISSTTSSVEPVEITINQNGQDAPQSHTYEHTFVSPQAISNNSITVGGATWNISATKGEGTPSFSTGNSSSKYGLKFGSSKTNYFSSVEFSTDYFSSKKVTSVTLTILNNGSVSGTFTAIQGDVQIGSETKTFGQTWTDLTAKGNLGTGGILTLKYDVTQAFYLNKIVVEYEDGGKVKTLESIAVSTPPTTTQYYIGEKFNPAGLVITATYDDASTEDIAYVGNESKFTFDPALDAALQTSNESVSITYGGKTTTQGVTVNARPVFTVSPSNNLANPIAVGEGEYDEEPISVTAGDDVVWTVAKVSGADDIEFTEGGTGSRNINVMIGANTGAARVFVLRVSSNTAGVSPASYDVYLSQEASSAITTVALATPIGLAYDNTGKKLTWNAVTTDVNGTTLVGYTPTYQINIDNKGWEDASSPYDPSELIAGTHTAQVKAIGNGTTYCDSEASTTLEFSIPQAINYSTKYDSNVTLPTSGTNVSSYTVTINSTDYPASKFGSSSKTGSGTFTIPSGTTKVHVHCAGWKGDTTTKVKFSIGGKAVYTTPNNLTCDSAITGNNTKVTLNGTASEYYYSFDVSNITSDTTVTVESTAKRFVLFGVNTE